MNHKPQPGKAIPEAAISAEERAADLERLGLSFAKPRRSSEAAISAEERAADLERLGLGFAKPQRSKVETP